MLLDKNLFELNGVLKVVLKLDLLYMAFGLVHSSVEQSTSRDGHLRLLYRLGLVLVLGLIVWKWVNLEHSIDSNQECGIGFGNSPGSLSHFWLTQGNLEIAEVLRVYAALNPQEEQICLY